MLLVLAMRHQKSSSFIQCHLLLACIFILGISTASADPNIELLLEKFEKQESRIKALEDELRELKSNKIEKTSKEPVNTASDKASLTSSGYNKGFFIEKKNTKKEEDFKLKVNGRMQFRYANFARRDRSYTFDNGVTGTQLNRNDFEIERARLEFSGHMLSPSLKYYLNFDFDTDGDQGVEALDYWFSYEASRAFELFAGRGFVPGSREYLDGSTSTHLAGRSLATNFFRPGRSIGLWASGEPLDGFFYRTMLGNAFDSSNVGDDEIDSEFTYALSLWSEPLADYGKGRADLSFHEELAVRAGSSFTFSPIETTRSGTRIGEANAIRLTDGSRISADISEYDLYLYAIDLALKYRGFSVNSEAYLRAVQNLKSDSIILADDSFTDRGLYVDVGYFIVKSYLEAVIRYSVIDGDLSRADEYAAGINYYINQTHKNKLTFDIALVDDSPLENSSTNYRVGDTGLLFRSQWQVAF